MKAYTTTIPTWSESRGEYKKPATTPEILNRYLLYGHEETHAAPLVLFAIGGKPEDNYCSNWDIYADSKGTLYSIARPGSGASGSYFGDAAHVKRLMKQGYFSDTLTAYGEKLLKGDAAA